MTLIERRVAATRRWAADHKKTTVVASVGAGGAAIYWVYVAVAAFWFGAMTLDEALSELRDDYPTALLQFEDETRLASSISNLEASTTGDIANGSVADVAEFVVKPEIATVLGIEPTRARLEQALTYADPQRPGYN